VVKFKFGVGEFEAETSKQQNEFFAETRNTSQHDRAGRGSGPTLASGG
jgi:hypothetical protein